MRGITINSIVVWTVGAMLLASQAGTLKPISYSYDTGDPYHASYPDSGGELTDGTIASTAFWSDSGWVGFHKTEVTQPVGIVFDFGTIQEFDGIRVFGLNNLTAGIAPLTNLTVSYSLDNITYSGTQSFATTGAEQAGDPVVREYARTLSGSGRYLHLTVDANLSEPPWLFLTEVQITPEPSSAMLLACGGAILFGRRRALKQ